ncbi:hypothetical protein D9Q98_000974 [Chlorella vulgaris]|uniref:Hexosyltransferase n=1 Tax=Chlorella vulgaris TaxID=3077 RepID=A0A9D4TZ11_CHLVU|nr:hypothetical protein D9Q98_000974 [Chlorella vulgaris]
MSNLCFCGRQQPAGLPSWRRSGAVPTPPAAVITSRTILAATLLLYTLVLLGLPLLYSSFAAGGRQKGVADMQGTLEPQLARALRSRRMALEAGQAAAAHLWPEAASHFGTAAAQLPRVEFRDAGNVVALVDALNISQWNELPLYLASPLPSSSSPRHKDAGSSSGGSNSQAQAGVAGSVAPFSFPPLCPQGDIRLFIGITSRCCTAEAQAKRAAVRKTWVRHARQHLPNVAIHFVLAQPSTEAELLTATELLKGEIAQHADLIVVPGKSAHGSMLKTLQLLKYALSSDCRYTHILKTDDDVFLRPQLLLDIISGGHYNFSVPVQSDGSGVFDGRPAPFYQAPWMSGMYVGQLDSEKGGVYPGWSPDRDPKSKWYLSEADLPTELAPLGVRWASGWGYLLSRDLAEYISNTALMYSAIPDKKPVWWGRMPWEDIMVATMLKDVAQVHHHDGFKAAWQECDKDVVLKHLDSDAPALQEGLYAQEVSGLWSKTGVVCSSGLFQLNNHTSWRQWRNSLPDNQLGGFM